VGMIGVGVLRSAAMLLPSQGRPFSNNPMAHHSDYKNEVDSQRPENHLVTLIAIRP